MRQFAVIGDPVAHSISPLLHRTAFARLGVPAAYDAFHVRPAVLGAFVGGTALEGYNVTIPHKARIVPFLDGLRGDALAAGAVNTVVREGGQKIGYNTDMDGLLFALRELGCGYSGASVRVFGTGGAARGAACKAASEGAREVRVLGRSREKAEAILSGSYGGMPSADAVRGADLFVNATPLGMAGYGEDFADLSFLDGLPAHAVVYDCVYTPAETALVRAARARGLRAETGLSMLVWQGLLSEALWGVAPREAALSAEVYGAVHEALSKHLEGTV
ncbi:MAG: hypothetical protein LBR00_04750 [Clostridiales Family XIII bacterium]|jgi:shikimate dehydrogenase|nr:hypothetical protein [Clostridiales Family XIII bacterium]